MPRETLKKALPGIFQHGFRKRGFRKPSFSGGWAPENGGASCPARETRLSVSLGNADWAALPHPRLVSPIFWATIPAWVRLSS